MYAQGDAQRALGIVASPTTEPIARAVPATQARTHAETQRSQRKIKRALFRLSLRALRLCVRSETGRHQPGESARQAKKSDVCSTESTEEKGKRWRRSALFPLASPFFSVFSVFSVVKNRCRGEFPCPAARVRRSHPRHPALVRACGDSAARHQCGRRAAPWLRQVDNVRCSSSERP